MFCNNSVIELHLPGTDYFSFYDCSREMDFAKAIVPKNDCSYIDRYLLKEYFFNLQNVLNHTIHKCFHI